MTSVRYYFLTVDTVQGPNLDCFAERIAAHPERLQYIYFNTVLLLRAVSRVGPFLSAYNLDSEHEPKTNALLNDVLNIAKSVGAFDEKALFTGSDAKVRIRPT
jgi:ERO1-like protein beta